jgi:hypothetical protein
VMSSLRVRSLRSLHRRLAAMTSSAYMTEIRGRLHPTSLRLPSQLSLSPPSTRI